MGALIAALAAAAQESGQQVNPLVYVWIPTIAVVASLGGLILAARKQPGEDSSRLYGDAMKMVAELKAQLAEETAKRETLALQLVEAKAERFELEQTMFGLRNRIDELERRLGGRREDDEPHRP